MSVRGSGSGSVYYSLDSLNRFRDDSHSSRDQIQMQSHPGRWLMSEGPQNPRVIGFSPDGDQNPSNLLLCQ